MALNGVPQEELRYASGLFNLMRNLGGAIGIAIISTLLQDYGRIHGERLGEAMGHGDIDKLGPMVGRMSGHGADAAHAQMVLSGEITQYVTGQALTQAFQDVFYLLAAAFVLALVIVPFAKVPPLSNNAPPVDAH